MNLFGISIFRYAHAVILATPSLLVNNFIDSPRLIGVEIGDDSDSAQSGTSEAEWRNVSLFGATIERFASVESS